MFLTAKIPEQETKFVVYNFDAIMDYESFEFEWNRTFRNISVCLLGRKKVNRELIESNKFWEKVGILISSSKHLQEVK